MSLEIELWTKRLVLSSAMGAAFDPTSTEFPSLALSHKAQLVYTQTHSSTLSSPTAPSEGVYTGEISRECGVRSRGRASC